MGGGGAVGRVGWGGGPGGAIWGGGGGAGTRPWWLALGGGGLCLPSLALPLTISRLNIGTELVGEGTSAMTGEGHQE